MSNPEAEAKKELGNKAFAAQDFNEAIKQYTAAIQIDPKNCVYFSNRSASHGGLSNWSAALTDAKECIKLNPSFLKGYYRLATAQAELHEFDAALSTIKQGLTMEPENPQLMKQLRVIKAKRASAKRANDAAAAANNAAVVPGGAPIHSNIHLDPTTTKEIQDLQTQLLQTTKEYRTVKAHILKSQKEIKSNQITKSELESLPNSPIGSGNNACDYKMYRAVGKMFLRSSRNEIMKHLEDGVERETKAEKDLTGKLEYLERRMRSMQANIQELSKGAAAE